MFCNLRTSRRIASVLPAIAYLLYIGTFMKHSMIVTPKEKNMLWENKLIGDYSPLACLRAVFNSLEVVL